MEATPEADCESTKEAEIRKFNDGSDVKNRNDPSEQVAEQNRKIIKALGKTPFVGEILGY